MGTAGTLALPHHSHRDFWESIKHPAMRGHTSAIVWERLNTTQGGRKFKLFSEVKGKDLTEELGSSTRMETGPPGFWFYSIATGWLLKSIKWGYPSQLKPIPCFFFNK